ncbi:MAG: hypothetical protein AB2417_05905 [Clostridiaceae bacterium]
MLLILIAFNFLFTFIMIKFNYYHEAVDKVGSYGSENIIMTGFTVLSAIKVTRYLRCDCGYSEEWIDDKEDIKTP